MSGGKISYPYFTLKFGLEPHVDTFPSNMYEQDRLNAISNSLQQHGHTVNNFEKIQSRYCEFTGGGDIYIENKVEGPLVFKLQQLPDDDEADDLNNKSDMLMTVIRQQIYPLQILEHRN